MPSVFNIIRSSIYAAVLAWTIVCLAIAVHFQGLLVSSDLTRFVPFAIFVCSASLLIFIVLLGFSLKKEYSPISTRIELACLGLAGTFWIALGAFLATSDSQEADVECFASETDTSPFDMPGFSTETYHAQYHVLEAFSLFNAILIWGFLIFLLFLAIRQHRLGHQQVWYTPVTSYPWFNSLAASKLPPPVTAQRSRSRGRSARDDSERPAATRWYRAGKPERTQSDRHTGSRHNSRRDRDEGRHGHGRGAQPPPPRAHTRDRRADKFQRDASPRR